MNMFDGDFSDYTLAVWPNGSKSQNPEITQSAI